MSPLTFVYKLQFFYIYIYICTKFGTTGLLADLITHDIFGNRLGGFDSVMCRILPFSYLQTVAVNTVLALPRSLWWAKSKGYRVKYRLTSSSSSSTSSSSKVVKTKLINKSITLFIQHTYCKVISEKACYFHRQAEMMRRVSRVCYLSASVASTSATTARSGDRHGLRLVSAMR